MSITSLRSAILLAGGSPVYYTHVELLRQLISTWGGTPTQRSINNLLKEAIATAGGTATQNTQTGLLKELVSTLGGSSTSFIPDALWALISVLPFGGTPTLRLLALSGNTVTEGAANGTVIGTILNTFNGSTVTMAAGSDARLATSLVGGVWYLVTTGAAINYEAAQSLSYGLVETLAGATGSPKTTPSLTVGVLNINDTQPAAFTLPTITGAALHAAIGDTITIDLGGSTDTVDASVSGDPSARINRNGGDYVTGPITGCVHGDVIGCALVTSDSNSTTSTATLLVGTTSATLSVTTFAAASGVAPSNDVAGTLTGTGIVGSNLTFTPGTWSGTPTPTVGWAWHGGGAEGFMGVSYALQTSDIGASIYVRETGTNSSGTLSVDTPAIGPIAAATSLATPTFSIASSAGAVPVIFSLSTTDYAAGMYAQVQISADNFATIAQDTGAVFISGDEWARLSSGNFNFTDPSGAYKARARTLRDNDAGATTVALPAGGSAPFDASPWSTPVSDTINISVAALNTVSGVNSSHYISSVPSSSNKGWYMNTNDGGLAMVRSTIPAGSNFTQSAARIDGYFASGTQFHCGMIDGTRNLDSPASTFSYPGTGAAGTSQKGFTFEVYNLDNHLGIYRNGGSQSVLLPFAMTVGDYVLWTLNKTTKVVNVYAYQAPANGANGLTGLLTSFTVDADHVPADDYYFFGGGQKGNAGDPTTSDGGTFVPDSAAIRAYDTGCNFYG